LASAGVLSKEELLAAAREYLENGRKVITINADKKPTLEKWTPLRDMNISIEQVNQWLSSPLAERIAILLDNSLVAFDYDGAGEYMFWDKLVPRCFLTYRPHSTIQLLPKRHMGDMSYFQ
jgi:hypothetical protein